MIKATAHGAFDRELVDAAYLDQLVVVEDRVSVDCDPSPAPPAAMLECHDVIFSRD